MRIGILASAVIVGLATVSFVLFPKRANLMLMRATGRVHFSTECTVFSPGLFADEEMFEVARTHVHERQRDGLLALYDTPIGSFWYPVTAWTLPALVEEMQRDRYHLLSSIKSGDVVMDVGANVGATARMALASGASTVIAVEPDPTALECLRRNLVEAIQEKRVIIIPEGAWNKEDTLSLNVNGSDAGGSSFVRSNPGSTVVPAHVTTLDRIVAKLNLSRVDVIKIHVEGAERNALAGAAETIRRLHPRLSIALDHNLGDAESIPALARQLWSGYHVTLTSCSKTLNIVTPKTALLDP